MAATCSVFMFLAHRIQGLDIPLPAQWDVFHEVNLLAAIFSVQLVSPFDWTWVQVRISFNSSESYGLKLHSICQVFVRLW